MWTRRELKDRAKPAFRKNYWKCVLVALVLMILVDGATSISGSGGGNAVNWKLDLSPDVLLEGNTDSYEDDYYSGFQEDEDTLGGLLEDISPAAAALIMTLGAGFILVFVLIMLAIQIFVCNPIEVGGCCFFVENTGEEANPGPGRLFHAFQSGSYGNIVMTVFLRNLYTVLWTMLLIVPGIVKGYEYRMIPYILAESPDMDRREVFRLSKEMMDGQKWNAFVLDLSFIGWDILSAFTFGLVGIFWTNPYRYATNAELYLTLKSGNQGYDKNLYF